MPVNQANTETFTHSHTGVYIPVTLQDALTYKQLSGRDSCYIFGGTLLQTQWEAGSSVPGMLISLENIDLLKKIHYLPEQAVLSIGAGITLHDCRNHPVIKTYCPPLSEAVKQIAAPAIRNRGTLGGNIMGRLGDLIPLLLAFDARLVFETHDGERICSLHEWLEEGQSDSCQILQSILIPSLESKETVFFQKMTRREAFAPAIVTVAASIRKDESAARVELRAAVGGGDNKPIRLKETEYLFNQYPREKTDWKRIYQSIQQEYRPKDDAYLSAAYKQKIAANTLISGILAHVNNKVRGETDA